MINHNIIKLAEIQLATDTDDVVKVAGILTSIQQWLSNFFDPSRSGRAAQILDKSLKIKPMLEDVKTVLNDIEKNISTADIYGYDINIEKLKKVVGELNIELNGVQQAIKETPKKEEANKETVKKTEVPIIDPDKKIKPQKKITPWKDLPRASGLPENYSFYEIGKPLNFYNITKENIHKSADWDISFSRSQSLKSFYTKDMDMENDLKELEIVVNKDFIQQKIYDQIPTWIIKDIKPRTLNEQGTPKSGMAELLVAGNVIVPTPSGKKWKLDMQFVLVDHSNYNIENMQIKFNIWQQYVKKIALVT